MSGHYVALSGGVGGAKLVEGLAQVLDPGQLTVVVNTGDDFEHLGLCISPDIDSVVYALAGLSDPVRGWGRRDETWTFMAALRQLGGEQWFQLGDGDLAMHVERSRLVRSGLALSDATTAICRALGIAVSVLPMSDDAVRTRVRTDAGWLDFQRYFVEQQCRPEIRELQYHGAASARAQPAVIAALQRIDLAAVIICPSNPLLSIEPMLAIPGLRSALENVTVPVVAVTPIINGEALKGPAAKILRELGCGASAQSVAQRYDGLIDSFVVDEGDRQAITLPGLRVTRLPTIMRSSADRRTLARLILASLAHSG